MPNLQSILRITNTLALCALVGWIGVDLLGKNVFGDRPWPDAVIDYRLIYDYSRHLLDTHRYPPVFPHPPAAALIQGATTQFPYPVSAAIWVALTGIVAISGYAVLLRMLRRDGRPHGWSLALLAHAAAAYFMQWELRSLNCNLVFLFSLILAVASLRSGRSFWTGFWFAISISLKLYPILAMPYLLWTRERRAFAWALGWLAVLWVALPVAVFGRDTVVVYTDWIEQITRAIDPLTHAPHPILISLQSAATWISGGSAALAAAIVWSVRSAWLLAIAGVFLSARRQTTPADSARLLADIALLTLAPIAVSPYLEPYHAVPFVMPAIVLIAIAADPARTYQSRLTAGILFAIALAIVPSLGPWAARGLIVNAKLFVAAVGAVAITRRSTKLVELPQEKTTLRAA